MKAGLAKALREWADAFDPPPPDDGDAQVCSAVTLQSPEAQPESRAEAALSLMDDECLGFFMLQVRAGEPPEVQLAGDVGEEYWRAIGVTLHQVARLAYGVRY